MIEDEEAIINWCPMMAGQKNLSQRCLASDCMAWRWATSDENETKGFCGLAGVPFMPTAARNR